MRRPWLLALSAQAAALLAFGSGPVVAEAPAARKGTVHVLAAASLKSVLDEAAQIFANSDGTKAVISYAASSSLAHQIEHGAPADLFISADLDWMDALAGKGLVRSGTRVDLAGNRLVLIAPTASNAPTASSARPALTPGFALAAALGDGRLAVADTNAAPAGKYAKAALKSLGLWASVEQRLAQAENVRAALAYVALGEAPLGIVYLTDAAVDPRVKVVGEFPEGTHPPIVYPAAVTRDAREPEAARALLDYLASPDGREVFTRHGFTVHK